MNKQPTIPTRPYGAQERTPLNVIEYYKQIPTANLNGVYGNTSFNDTPSLKETLGSIPFIDEETIIEGMDKPLLDVIEGGYENKEEPIPQLSDKMPNLEAGLRYNKNKLRYDLLDPYAVEQLVKVFTLGATKYAPRNWEKGMSWTSVVASLKRHVAEFEKGNDFDDESKLYHMAHAAWNAMCLVSYYKMAPTFDDREHTYLKMPKIGLDIDNVICDWTKAWGERYGLPTRPSSWQFSYDNKRRFDETPKEELEAFYKTLPTQCCTHDIPFEPCAYLTARSVDIELTKKWIEDNGFPTAPVYSVPFGASKVEIAKEAGIEWFIDDSYANFVELNNAGIFCLLYDAPHNQRYNVGFKRVKDFADFKERFL